MVAAFGGWYWVARMSMGALNLVVVNGLTPQWRDCGERNLFILAGDSGPGIQGVTT